MKTPFWVIGHRGSPARTVENTIASFAAALDEGANGLEVDVSVTREGRGVLWHDWDPNSYKSILRAMGVEPYMAHKPVAPWGAWRKPVSSLSLAEFLEHHGYAERRWNGPRVEARVPTLREFFEWAVRELRLGSVFFDLKIPRQEIGLVPVVLAELDALVARLSPRFRVVLETAEIEILAALRELGSRHASCFDVEPRAGVVRDAAGCSAVARAIEYGACIAGTQRPRAVTWMPFATHRRIVLGDLALLRSHNAGSPAVPLEGVVSFTINDEREMAALIRLGVAGIQTDRPRVLCRVAERLAKVGWRVDAAMPSLRYGEALPRSVHG